MEAQRFVIKGHVVASDDEGMQSALADVYDTAERPRCLCVAGGVEMYVAKHRVYLVKRMPDSASRHHPSCPSYEPETGQSGLGELIGEAIIVRSPEVVELRVGFPLARTPGKVIPHGDCHESGEVKTPQRRMTLRAVLHFLFERARFNHWVPAMAGKRNQGVVHKYLMEAAHDVITKGVQLADRLYVPEPFSEANKAAIADRRRAKLAILYSAADELEFKMALVIGEFKAVEPAAQGRKVWIKHMPDTPLFVSHKAWERVERAHGKVLEGRDADCDRKSRVMMCAVIYAKRERVYQIDVLTLMLTTDQWIPVEASHELPLIHALVDQGRCFVKPMRYDARMAASFPNVLLLDAGDRPVELHVVSAFMDAKEKAAKLKAIKDQEIARGNLTWVWHTDQPMAAFPAVAGQVDTPAAEHAAGSERR